MRRALLAACALGAVSVVLVAAADERSLAFTINVRSEGVTAVTRPGEEVCQRGIEPAARFELVEIQIGAFAGPGPPLTLTVRETHRGGRLSTGTFPATDDGQPAVDPLHAEGEGRKPAVVRLARRVARGGEIDVCIRNRGSGDVVFYGGPTRESVGHAFVQGRPAAGDIRLAFHRAEPRSALSMVPDMFDRAALFKPEPIGAWAFWGLLAGVLAGIPLLLAAALRAAVRGHGDAATHAEGDSEGRT